MAINVNYRMLMLLLGLVIMLNVLQIMVSVNRSISKAKDQRALPIVIDISEARMNVVDSFKQLDELHWPSVARTVSTPVEVANETCPNTDVTAYDEQEPNMCPQIPPGLGPEPPVLMTTEWLPALLNGGIYKNRKCLAQQSIGIIVPYSGPKKHLIYFLSHLHPFMMKQQADYQVFVVDYVNKSAPLARGQLFNVGFMEAQRHRQWQCLVFHEPYLVPVDSRNLYRCDWYPKHLVADIVNVHTLDNKTYQPMVGGAVALTPEQFSKVNGFSNRVTKRNGDYLDLYKRIQWANYTLERSDVSIGKYKTLVEPITVSLNESFYSSTVSPFHLIDGLSTLTYNVGQVDYQPLYTYLQVGRSEDFEQKSNNKMLDVLLSHVLHQTNSHISSTKL